MKTQLVGIGLSFVVLFASACTKSEAASSAERDAAVAADSWLKLVDDGKVDRALARTLYPTFVASAFRSLRFGLGDAHGKGMALQLSWFLDAGGIAPRPDGTMAIDEAKMKAAVVSLTRELMTLQAKGDRGGATALLAKMGVVRPEIAKVLGKLGAIPVDIAPRFVTAEALARP